MLPILDLGISRKMRLSLENSVVQEVNVGDVGSSGHNLTSVMMKKRGGRIRGLSLGGIPHKIIQYVPSTSRKDTINDLTLISLTP